MDLPDQQTAEDADEVFARLPHPSHVRDDFVEMRERSGDEPWSDEELF